MAVYSLTEGFPRMLFLATMTKLHQNKEEHPDFIPSAPEWTKVSDCDCGFE